MFSSGFCDFFLGGGGKWISWNWRRFLLRLVLVRLCRFSRFSLISYSKIGSRREKAQISGCFHIYIFERLLCRCTCVCVCNVWALKCSCFWPCSNKQLIFITGLGVVWNSGVCEFSVPEGLFINSPPFFVLFCEPLRDKTTWVLDTCGRSLDVHGFLLVRLMWQFFLDFLHMLQQYIDRR